MVPALLSMLGSPKHALYKPDIFQNPNMPKELQEISPVRQETDALRHDLRTHISAIISLAEMIKKEPEHGNKSHLLDALQLAAGNALAIMDGNIYQRQTSVGDMINILDLLKDFELLARGLIQSSSAQLNLEIDQSLQKNPYYRTDQVQLHRVLMLLLDNAFQYAPGSDLTLAASRTAQGDIQLCLCDYGTGFGDENPELLFMPYHRGSKHRSIQGTGLGLWSARNILNLLGGSINAEPNTPHGACFIILLPNEPPSPPQTGNQSQAKGTESCKGKVLVVDDNKTNHLILGEMLKSLGFDPTHCLSGPQALDQLARNHYDLALIDIRMADMDGWELARQIRNTKQAEENVPLIALSADSAPAKLNHFSLWLQRPIRPGDLIKALQFTSPSSD